MSPKRRIFTLDKSHHYKIKIMIGRIIKWGIVTAVGLFANWNANQFYEENTLTDAEHRKFINERSTQTPAEQTSIDRKLASQKTISYKIVAWYQGKKAGVYTFTIKHLESLRDKLGKTIEAKK